MGGQRKVGGGCVEGGGVTEDPGVGRATPRAAMLEEGCIAETFLFLDGVESDEALF